MAPSEKRPRTSDSSKSIRKPQVTFDASTKSNTVPKTETSKPTTAPRPTPSFLSSLQNDETDFPRGGGSSLTALEYKQVRDEGRREAEEEDKKARSGPGVGQGVKRKRQMSTREIKRAEKNVVKAPGKEVEGYRKSTTCLNNLTWLRLMAG
jgi:rRNA biogenesis protein RRP5